MQGEIINLTVITSCSSRKKLHPTRNLQLRNYSMESSQISQWLDALKNAKSNKMRAEDMYIGDHFSKVKEIYRSGKYDQTKNGLWIMSAGYGLLNSYELINSYSATFANNQTDSIIHNGSREERERYHQFWVDEIMDQRTKYLRHMNSNISSLQDEIYKNQSLLIISSKTYLMAFKNIFIKIIKEIGQIDYFFVISADPPYYLSDLGAVPLKTNINMRKIVGGTLNSLNARVARMIFKSNSKNLPSTEEVMNAFNNLQVQSNDCSKRVLRKKISDMDVEKIICNQLEKEKNISKSNCLRKLRDLGFACEQSRFNKIFKEINKSGSFHE